jgi:hypothetical protein
MHWVVKTAVIALAIFTISSLASVALYKVKICRK